MVRVLSADLSSSDVLDQVSTMTDDIEGGLLVFAAGQQHPRTVVELLKNEKPADVRVV
jgi:hypothetical protein